MTACRVLRSRLTYFWRYMNISSIFYFLKSTSINTQYSSLWDTLKMMLLTKYLIKWKRIGGISWNFRHWFDFKSSTELDIKRYMLELSNAPLISSKRNTFQQWNLAWVLRKYELYCHTKISKSLKKKLKKSDLAPFNKEMKCFKKNCEQIKCEYDFWPTILPLFIGT